MEEETRTTEETAETVNATSDSEVVENPAEEAPNEEEAAEGAEQGAEEPSFEEVVATRIKAVEDKVAAIAAWVDEQVAAHEKKKDALKGFFAPVPKDREREVTDGKITVGDVISMNKKYI